MLGLEMFDVAIGMVFIFLLLSLVCSAFNEIIEALFKKRATYLEQGIRELLNDKDGTGLVKDLYSHPLISALFGGRYNPEKVRSWWLGRTNLPSYIPARNFALALIDLVLNPPGLAKPKEVGDDTGSSTAVSIESLRNAIAIRPNNDQVKRVLKIFVEDEGADVNKVRESIEAWYDGSMDRVSGWYKRYTQVIILILGLIVAITLNADTVAIVQSLSLDPTLRSSVISAAQQYLNDASLSSAGSASSASTPACDKDPNSPECRLEKNLAEIKKLGLPIGWNRGDPRSVPPDLLGRLIKVFGWFLTAVAISLGAPFWFDLLNKFLVVRSTVKPHEKSPEETSEDR